MGLNVSSAHGRFAGIANYAFWLSWHLPRVAPNEEWIFFGPESEAFQERTGVKVVPRVPGTNRILWEQTMLPIAAWRARLDLLHGADFSRPVKYGRPTINTIHDLSPYASRFFFSGAKRIYKRNLISFTVRASDAIITVSEFSRRELLHRFPFLAGRVFAVHLGVEPTPEASPAKADRPFLLFVGTMEHRKNVTTLIRAFRILSGRRRLPHRLVLVGKPGHGWDAIHAALEQRPSSDDIEILGYVTAEHLAELYQSADLFVYPSLYEGFGLPLLEAMAVGTPVVSSSAASLPEVGGDAAVYFDPLNVEELADAIERVLDSSSLRGELRAKGLKRAAGFTWEECARKHVEVYRNVLGQ